MEFYWDNGGKLKIQVHWKKNQLLNYLNKESNHTKAAFKSILNGVLKRLTKLTSIMRDNAKNGINELYLNITMKLAKAGLDMNILQPWRNYGKIHMIGKKKNEKRKGKRGGKRNVYFCIRLSQLWRENIKSVIKIPQKYHGLKWFLVRMYHRWFPNLGEILKVDMVVKIREIIGSKYFPNRECNSNSKTKVKGTCAYGC